MGLQIISAEQRLAEKRGHKIVVCGQSGVGKTTLARTLNSDSTLFMDLEAGDAAIEGYPIDVIRPKTWAECRDFACYLGGPNPSLSDDQPYSKAHYDYVCQTYGDPDAMLTKYDARAAYGMHGREMMAWLTHLQHIRSKNVIFVGILDESTDDYGRKQYQLQIEGSKTGKELPGIVDEVITMAVMSGDKGPFRAFVCNPLNEWGYPAKDRSGRLDVLEEPHLGKLIQKMGSGPTQAERPLTFVDPNQQNSSEGE
jgi:hypothetical protein